MRNPHYMRRVDVQLALLAACAAAAVVFALHGCGSSDSTSTAESDSGASEGGGPDAMADAALDVATPEADADAFPPGVPNGWIRLPGYDKRCGLFVPSEPKYLPTTVAWTACPSSTDPVGANCSFLDPITVGPGATDLSPFMAGSVDAVSEAHLQISGFVGTHIYRLVLRGDGTVENAILETTSSCTLGKSSLFRSSLTYDVYSEPFGYGTIAADSLSAPPTRLLAWGTEAPHRSFATALGIFDLSGTAHVLSLYPWSGGQNGQQIFSDALDTAGLQQGPVVASPDACFWTSSSSHYSRIRSYSAARGVEDFISSGNDPSQGDVNIGTDGTDLVWTHGMARTTTTGPYPQLELRTSPYTSAPQSIVARHLRTDVGDDSGLPQRIPVGCGYAMYSNVNSDVRVVRLSDGFSWVLPGTTSASSRIDWNEGIAITCDDIFVRGHLDKQFNQPTIVKIPLAALGPGIPPN